MGFNIAAIAINKNCKNELDELQKQFNWKLKHEGEVSFEAASENWKEDGICDIYFTEHGTLIFVSMEVTIQSFRLNGCNVLTFALSETSMAFNILYCEGNELKREIVEVDGERHVDEGTPLQVESDAEDTSEIIWKQLEVILGKRYWDIGLEEQATRYTFIK